MIEVDESTRRIVSKSSLVSLAKDAEMRGSITPPSSFVSTLPDRTYLIRDSMYSSAIGEVRCVVQIDHEYAETIVIYLTVRQFNWLPLHVEREAS